MYDLYQFIQHEQEQSSINEKLWLHNKAFQKIIHACGADNKISSHI